ncbi:MAG: DNA primase [Planctomycetes bacterium]|nr:DNA primase [Planctomycetota bacterium]
MPLVRTDTSDRDRVLDATDLVALVGESVALRLKGREHVGLCPFHEDHRPSFSVVTHKVTQTGHAFYHCFACQASGNAIDFMVKYHKMDFLEALRYLAQRAGIELRPRGGNAGGDGQGASALRRANEAGLRFFTRCLSEPTLGGPSAQALAARSIEPAMIERFGLGAAPASGDALVAHVERLASNQRASGDDAIDSDAIWAAFESAGLLRRRGGRLVDGFRNRVMFPIQDEIGRCVAFGARAIDPDDQPKYLNSPESSIFHKSRSLYGIHLAKRAIIDSRTAIITEGYTDVIACHRAGIENAVATLGTALTRDHARILQRLCDTVVLLFDGDAAGQRAADRALEVFFAAPIDVRICTLPDQLDPDELLRQPGGRDRFDAAVAEAVDALEHLVGRFRSELDERSGMSARQRTIQAMVSKLASLGLASLDGLRRRMVIDAIASAAGVPASDIEAELMRSTASARRSAAADETATLGATIPAASTALARAEREFVGLLLAWPVLTTSRLETIDGDSLPIGEFVSPDSFADAPTAQVFRVLHERIEAASAFNLQDVLAEFDDDALKAFVTSLFRTAYERHLDEPSARTGLVAAARALELTRRRQALSEPAAVSTPEALAERIALIRAAGPRPSAIARRIDS